MGWWRLLHYRSLRAGDEVRGVFACVRKDRLKTRTGSAYLALELRDKTGSVQARASATPTLWPAVRAR